MKYSPYPYIDELFDDYDSNKKLINRDSPIMINYPKIMAMAIGSTYEDVIIKTIDDFVSNPLPGYTIPALPTSSIYTIGGMAYKKFIPRPTPKADKFYNLFDTNFKNDVENRFTLIKTNMINKLESELVLLSQIYTTNTEYENSYLDTLDLKDTLVNCSFDTAENALLEMKFSRNNVAHHYMDESSKNMEDIRKLFQQSMYYVKAIDDIISNMTVH